MFELISIFSAAAIGGILASILRQPVILGYLIAGIVIGPFGLKLIQEYEQVEVVAELGVTFLLFAIGVEFSFAELNKVKKIAVGGGGLQITITIILTLLISMSLGWVESVPEGILLGELLSLSSTAVVLKVLMERNETETFHGQVMLGILIVQDLALGLMLAVLPTLNKPAEEIGIAIVIALIKLALFALGAVIVGKWIMPPFLKLLAKTESKELFLLGVVTICLSIALFTGELGLSTEMGAFVAGLMISEIEYADETLNSVEPLRDICVVAFFASIGVLINPIFLWDNLPIILGLVALVFIGKSLIITPLVFAFGYPFKAAVISGLGLAQIGEFSFVLAGEGNKFGLLPESTYLLILGTTAVTLVVTPFILEGIPFIFASLESFPRIQSFLEKLDRREEIVEEFISKDHIIVCGYGRVGSNVVQLLQDRQYPVLVIEESEQKVKKLRQANIPYIYGSAASDIVLEKAGVDQAKGMAITLPDPMNIRLCLRRSLKLNPDLDLVVRANDEEDIEMLYQMGAKEVVQPDFEASLELSSHLFSGLGFPLDGIQQNMKQIRSSHYQALRPGFSDESIAQELQAVSRRVNSRWCPLPPDCLLIGKTLEQTYIRLLTGATVIAIYRSNGERIDYPDPKTDICRGDKFLMVGDDNDLFAFNRLIKGEVTELPNPADSFLWVLVPKNSPIAGQTIEEINFSGRFNISIQAIRREGQYLRFPDGSIKIEAEYHLLLFGPIGSITQVTQAIAADATNLIVPS